MPVPPAALSVAEVLRRSGRARVRAPVPLRLAVAPAATVRGEPPRSEPPLQPNDPVTVKTPGPPRPPPETTSPLNSDAPPTVSVPLVICKVSAQRIVAAAAFEPIVTTNSSGTSMRTSSDAVGTPSGAQFAASLHAPVRAPPSQVLVPACAWAASPSPSRVARTAIGQSARARPGEANRCGVCDRRASLCDKIPTGAGCVSGSIASTRVNPFGACQEARELEKNGEDKRSERAGHSVGLHPGQLAGEPRFGKAPLAVDRAGRDTH